MADMDETKKLMQEETQQHLEQDIENMRKLETSKQILSTFRTSSFALFWLFSVVFTLFVGIQIGKFEASQDFDSLENLDTEKDDYQEYPNKIESNFTSSREIPMEAKEDLSLQPLSQPYTVETVGKQAEYEEVESDSVSSSMPEPTQMSSALGDDCEGRRIYLQKLPTVYNFKLCELVYHEDALTIWDYTCPQLNGFRNGKLEREKFPPEMVEFDGLIYDTSQFDLNSIIHYRIANSKCRVYNREKADLIYNEIFLEPLAGAYYKARGTIHGAQEEIVLLFHYLYHVMRTGKVVWPNPVNDIKKDVLAMKGNIEAIEKLPDTKQWQQCQGCDQIIVNSRIPMDFHHFTHIAGGPENMFREEEWKNIKFVAIEGFTQAEMNMFPYFHGIPYPGHIHPTNELELKRLISLLKNRRRTHKISIIGKPRRKRLPLMNHCDAMPDSDCISLSCAGPTSACRTDGAVNILNIMADSRFCYQPHGDSPTRQGFFDSIAIGCIPVVPDSTSYKGYMEYSIHHPETFTLVAPNIREALKQINDMGEEGYQKMFKTLLEVMPSILYAHEDVPFNDAVSVLFKRIGCDVSSEKGTTMLPYYCKNIEAYERSNGGV